MALLFPSQPHSTHAPRSVPGSGRPDPASRTAEGFWSVHRSWMHRNGIPSDSQPGKKCIRNYHACIASIHSRSRYRLPAETDTSVCRQSLKSELLQLPDVSVAPVLSAFFANLLTDLSFPHSFLPLSDEATDTAVSP